MKLVVEVLQVGHETYLARCPMLPGCVVRGPSPRKAEERMRDAIAGYLAGLDVAEPRDLELLPQE